MSGSTQLASLWARTPSCWAPRTTTSPTLSCTQTAATTPLAASKFHMGATKLGTERMTSPARLLPPGSGPGLTLTPSTSMLTSQRGRRLDMLPLDSLNKAWWVLLLSFLVIATMMGWQGWALASLWFSIISSSGALEHQGVQEQSGVQSHNGDKLLARSRPHIWRQEYSLSRFHFVSLRYLKMAWAHGCEYDLRVHHQLQLLSSTGRQFLCSSVWPQRQPNLPHHGSRRAHQLHRRRE